MADTEKPAAPLPYVPPSQIDPAELMKAFVEDGVIEKPVEVAKPADAKPAEVAKPPEKPADDDTPALLKIAKKRDELRKAQEQVEPHISMLKQFSPQEAQRLAAARASGDPVAALAALGFTHSQYNAALAGVKKPAEAAPAAPSGNPELDSVRQELAAMKQEREDAKIQTSRQQFLSHTEKLLKDDPKFSHLSALGEWQSVEKAILNHINEFGAPPGETLDESIKLAAELVEHGLKKEAERWQKVLTGFQKPASTESPKAPESPRPGSESPRTLTNANATAPAVPRAAPKSREEILELIASGGDLSGLDP